ncbi:hypothetical protein H634G_11504 [Metarhizium anisopliae BRIP 53293]|uniref:Uncharacterized protein n=1 Tax=Metarhizium anisopliae BRIP 53293 TaxID=1291518 RepID=A0A0D9NH53_METAN|nr:hypothetical protein H634G_11504 [Metarhizium anisopliae BRIP 53293]
MPLVKAVINTDPSSNIPCLNADLSVNSCNRGDMLDPNNHTKDGDVSPAHTTVS